MVLLTVVISMALYIGLIAADGQCTRYQFNTPFYPGSSCEDIYNKNPESRDVSGYYWITDGLTNVYCGMSYTGPSCEDIYNNNPETGNKTGYYRINNQWSLCNMTLIAAIADGRIILSCAGVEGQWRRIAGVDISAGDDCPTGWNRSSFNGINFCRTPNDNGGCYSTFFSASGASYQHVCGRARGYQKGSPDAFSYGTPLIDRYVDGLSITYGDPRQHIWTYAAGLTDNQDSSCCNCPCASIPGSAPPSFVGDNFYCESGVPAGSSWDAGTYYLSDALWDGMGCSVSNTCCSNTDQPWFHRQLNETTQDDIEVRICTDLAFSDNEGVLVDILELYIK